MAYSVVMAVYLFSFHEGEKQDQLQGKPAATLSSRTTSQVPDLERARAELRADALKPIRDFRVILKLDREYSVEDLGHFRILFVVAGSDDVPEFYFAARDAYLPNESIDPKSKQFGVRYTVRYRSGQSYAAIPVYTREPKFTTVIGLTGTTDELEFSIDLYNQIPSIKILEDLNRKYLRVYVTEPLTERISSFSLAVNNYELIAEKSSALLFTGDQPKLNWSMPSSAAENAVHWREMYLKPTDEISRMIPPNLKEGGPLSVVWSLDFAIIKPKKLPEPEIKVNPYEEVKRP